jgi:hypothetical protein
MTSNTFSDTESCPGMGQQTYNHFHVEPYQSNKRKTLEPSAE